jgi:hypothetical protein
MLQDIITAVRKPVGQFGDEVDALAARSGRSEIEVGAEDGVLRPTAPPGAWTRLRAAMHGASGGRWFKQSAEKVETYGANVLATREAWCKKLQVFGEDIARNAMASAPRGGRKIRVRDADGNSVEVRPITVREAKATYRRARALRREVRDHNRAEIRAQIQVGRETVAGSADDAIGRALTRWEIVMDGPWRSVMPPGMVKHIDETLEAAARASPKFKQRKFDDADFDALANTVVRDLLVNVGKVNQLALAYALAGETPLGGHATAPGISMQFGDAGLPVGTAWRAELPQHTVAAVDAIVTQALHDSPLAQQRLLTGSELDDICRGAADTVVANLTALNDDLLANGANAQITLELFEAGIATDKGVPWDQQLPASTVRRLRQNVARLGRARVQAHRAKLAPEQAKRHFPAGGDVKPLSREDLRQACRAAVIELKSQVSDANGAVLDELKIPGGPLRAEFEQQGFVRQGLFWDSALPIGMDADVRALVDVVALERFDLQAAPLRQADLPAIVEEVVKRTRARITQQNTSNLQAMLRMDDKLVVAQLRDHHVELAPEWWKTLSDASNAALEAMAMEAIKASPDYERRRLDLNELQRIKQDAVESLRQPGAFYQVNLAATRAIVEGHEPGLSRALGGAADAAPTAWRGLAPQDSHAIEGMLFRLVSQQGGPGKPLLTKPAFEALCERAVRLARRPVREAPPTWPESVHNDNLVYSMLEQADATGRTETDHLLVELGFIGPQDDWREALGPDAVAFLHEEALRQVANDPSYKQDRLHTVDAMGAIREAASLPGFKERIAAHGIARQFDPDQQASRLHDAVRRVGGTPPTEAVLQDIAARANAMLRPRLTTLHRAAPGLPVEALVAQATDGIDQVLDDTLREHRAALDALSTGTATAGQKKLLAELGAARCLNRAEVDLLLNVAHQLNGCMKHVMFAMRRDNPADAVPVLVAMLDLLEAAQQNLPDVPADELQRSMLDLAMAADGIDSARLRSELSSPTALRLMRAVANSPDPNQAARLPSLMTALAGTGFGATLSDVRWLAAGARQDMDLGDPLLMRAVYRHAKSGIDFRGVILRKGYGHLLASEWRPDDLYRQFAEMSDELNRVAIVGGLSQDFAADLDRSTMLLNGILLPTEPEALFAHFPDTESGRAEARALSLCMGQSVVLAMDDRLRHSMMPAPDTFILVGSNPCTHEARRLADGSWEVSTHMALIITGAASTTGEGEAIHLPAGLHVLHSVTTRVSAESIASGQPRPEFVSDEITFSL